MNFVCNGLYCVWLCVDVSVVYCEKSITLLYNKYA